MQLSESILAAPPQPSACAYDLSAIPASPCWHTGKLLAFSHLDGPTDYAGGLVARTLPGGLAFQYPGTAQLHFPAARITQSRITSDWFEAGTNDSVLVRGVILDAHHLLIEGACELASASSVIASHVNGDRLLIGSAAHFNPALIGSDFDTAAHQRLRWLDTSLRQVRQSVSPPARRTLIRALSQMKGQVCSPEGIIRHPWTTPDRWPHRNMWLWDSAFHAIGWRHIDARLARQTLDAVFDAQAPDGFIPHMAGPLACSRITQPPILALGAQLVFEKTGDLDWLASVYPKLCAYLDWNATRRDTDGGGLLEWHIEGDPDCRSGESGMDNSPRFDTAVPLDAPDFNAYQAHEYEILAAFARLLNRPAAEARRWSARHAALCARINEKLWSAEHRLYCDFDPRAGRHTGVLASAGFLPLLCGAPDARQAAALAAHLENPATFGTPFPIPSISTSDAARYSKDMWRGPSWININWLVARGLRRYGLHAAADRLRALTLAELERTCERWGTFFEYFDDRREVEPPALLRKRQNIPGRHPHQAIHDYGWSATLYVDWLLT